MRRLAALAGALAVWLVAPAAAAAVGCALNDPEEDLRRFFPELTDFQTHYVTFEHQDPEAYQTLERRLGGALDKVYETIDVPYTLYAVQQDGAPLGWVFGANQRGTYSNLQIVAVTDPDLKLERIYFQKIRSPRWKDFASEAFTKQLVEVGLDGFAALKACYTDGACDGAPISDPTDGAEAEDYRNILRGLAKLRLVRDLLLRPGQPVVPRDRTALSEWVGAWWTGETTPLPVDEPTWARTWDEPGWAPETPVLLWPPGQRIYPLPVLTRHPVVFDGASTPAVTVTWSVTSQTAVMLAVTGAPVATRSPFRPTGDTLFGTRLVADRRTRTQWAPALADAIRGPQGALEARPVGGAFVTTWARARGVAPGALVLSSPRPREELDALWTRATRRYDGAGEVLAVVDGDQAAAAAPGAGLRALAVGKKPVLLVDSAAWRAPGEDVRVAAVDPWTGAPWLASPDGSVWDGWTGEALAGEAEALAPLPAFTLPRRAFGAMFPGAVVQDG